MNCNPYDRKGWSWREKCCVGYIVDLSLALRIYNEYGWFRKWTVGLLWRVRIRNIQAKHAHLSVRQFIAFRESQVAISRLGQLCSFALKVDPCFAFLIDLSGKH